MVISFHFEIKCIISNIASSPAGRNKTVTEQKNGENSKARSMLLYRTDANLKKLISVFHALRRLQGWSSASSRGLSA